MKNVLITGVAGFIGSHLADKFLKEGWQVIGVDNFLTGNKFNISHLDSNSSFTFVEADVSSKTDFQQIDVGNSLDAVLHFACPASPMDYYKYPLETMQVNSYGTFHTLDLAQKMGATYLFASTSEVYGDPQVHPQVESYWGNVNPHGPRSVYDEAKRFSEAVSMSYHREYDMDVRIVRIFNTYGPRMKLDDGRVVPNFIAQALRGEDITIYGDGSQTRSFCYVSDLVEGIFRFTSFKNLEGEVMNLGNPDEYKIRDFANIILRKVGSDSMISFEPLPEDDPRQRCPDISKAQELINWQPETSLDDGLAATIEFFQGIL